jgi:hypothetical protein
LGFCSKNQTWFQSKSNPKLGVNFWLTSG